MIRNNNFYFYFAVSSPVIVKQPVDVNVTLCKSASFICTAHGFGLTKITWKRVNYSVPIRASVKEERSSNNLSSTLKIFEVDGYYSGQYYCVAENGAGKIASQIAHLHVKQSS